MHIKVWTPVSMETSSEDRRHKLSRKFRQGSCSIFSWRSNRGHQVPLISLQENAPIVQASQCPLISAYVTEEIVAATSKHAFRAKNKILAKLCFIHNPERFTKAQCGTTCTSDLYVKKLVQTVTCAKFQLGLKCYQNGHKKANIAAHNPCQNKN